MCTAVSMQGKEHYFGRNLDLEYSYDEQIVVTPRNFPFRLRLAGEMRRHFAMVGMACLAEGYPLYYEATNEKGLSMAGLNFPGNAVWFAPCKEKTNIAPFELIPWVLGNCENLARAKELLAKVNIADVSFDPQLPNSPLHWLLADQSGALVVEQTAEGLKVYDNPVGVLTNNPPFGWHLTNLCSYMALGAADPQSRFAPRLGFAPYSRGMGSLGLPGDYSSASRFVRAAFVLHNTAMQQDEADSVGRFFHILDSVAMPCGCVLVGEGEAEFTRYSCCCNTTKGIYYYTTYQNRAITAVDMHRENLEGRLPMAYPLKTEQKTDWQN